MDRKPPQPGPGAAPRRARFRTMADSTAEDWAIIVAEQRRFMAGLPQRVLAHLRLLDQDYGGFPVDRLQHCLQTAERAAEDGRDEEYVVCALLHDLGDTLGSYNHADLAAAVLEPFVSEANHWMVKHHAVFQGYNFFHHLGMERNLRDAFRASPHFDRTEEFVRRYDNTAFDHERPRLPLDPFVPMVERVLSRPRNSLYQSLLEE